MKEQLQGTVIIADHNNRFVAAECGGTIPFDSSTKTDFLVPGRATSFDSYNGKDGYECFPIPEEFRGGKGNTNYILLPNSAQWYIDYSKELIQYRHEAIATIDRDRINGQGNPFIEKVTLVMQWI